MQTLCLQPAMRHEPASEATTLILQQQACRDEPHELYLTPGGGWSVNPQRKRTVQRSQWLMTLLVRDTGGPKPAWLMIPRDPDLMHNGVRPLSLAILEPGDALAVGQQRWLAAELWQAKPGPAPEKVADRECPVCGAFLSLANVVQCPCGRYYHLEKPEEPDNQQALNCYLIAGECGLCHREPSLRPVFLPTPPEEVVAPEDLEATLARV